jgi:hypothetical protein
MFAYVALNYISNTKQIVNSDQKQFPLKKAFFVYIVSISISSMFSPDAIGIYKAALTAFQSIFTDFIFAYLLWRELKSSRDIRFFIKGVFIVFCIAILYGSFERFNNFYNPLIDYESSIAYEGMKNQAIFRYSEDNRGGLGRVQSIFNNALNCSALAGVAFVFFYYINLRYKKIWTSSVLIKILFLAGLLFLLLFSNSRGGIVYIGISLLFMLKLKKILQLALLLPFFVVIFYDVIEPYTMMLSSIFDLASSTAGGSSFVMRTLQFSSVIEILEGSPWFGYGLRTHLYWLDQRPDLLLLGLESIWLKLLIQQGIVGVIVHIYLIYSMVKLGIGKSKRYVIGIVISFVVVTTATIGLSIEFFMGLLLVVYRLELLSISSNMVQIAGDEDKKNVYLSKVNNF